MAEDKSPESNEEIQAPEEDTITDGITDPIEIEKALGVYEEPEEEENEESKTEESEEQSEDGGEKSEDDAEDEEKSEEEEESEEEDEKSETPQPEVNDEAELWKKRYADSTKEFETKYKPMEQELESLKPQYEDLQMQMENTANIIASDPELAARFLQIAESGAVKPVEKRAETKVELPDDVKELVEWAKSQKASTETQREEARVEAILAFEKEHPDLTDDDRANLGRTASALQSTLKLTDKEALDRAYISLYPEKVKEKLDEKSKKEALLNETKKKKATTQKVPGASSAAQNITLTAEQKKVARQFGMSEEEYFNSAIKK